MPHALPVNTSATPIKTLHARLYHDPAQYEKECRMLFHREWLLFCHEAQLQAPGNYVAYTVAGRPLLVIRGKDGVIKGFHNVCRHRASLVLREGMGKADILRCMYHGWVYDTDGHLCKTPHFGGDEKSLCDRTSLFPLHVRTSRGLVFISMAENPPRFEDSLGDLPAMLEGIDLEGFKYFDSATHPLACNWKTYVENYMEGYHIPIAHPALNKEIDFATYKVITGKRIARHETKLKKADAINNGLWIWLWPHVALNIYANGMNLELVIPTGAETTELRYCYLFHDVSQEKTDENHRTIKISRDITQEDIELCEAVQKNLRAGVYQRGELSPRHENGIAYFHDMVRQLDHSEGIEKS